MGYVVYYGTAAGVYSTRTDVGQKLTCTASNLTEEVCYYFMATSYYVNGVESLPSNEVSFVVPRTNSATTLTIVLTPDGSVSIQGNGITGQTYRIEYTEAVGAAAGPAWRTAGSAVADNAGQFSFAEAVASPSRFYRSVRP